jgi:hypothetical protein
MSRGPAEGCGSLEDQAEHGDPGEAGHLFDLLLAHFHLARLLDLRIVGALAQHLRVDVRGLRHGARLAL